jgi:rubredoxin
MRKSRYNIPLTIWRCPHCGFEHGAADLLRVDGDTFRCKKCGEEFPSGKGEERGTGPAGGQ